MNSSGSPLPVCGDAIGWNGSDYMISSPMFQEKNAFVRIFRISVIGLYLLLTTPLNVLVVVALLRQRGSVTSRGFVLFAVSLALTDAGVGILVLPFHLMVDIANEWPLGSAACHMWLIADYGFISVSMFLVVAMGFDRYQCVKSPLLYRANFTRRRPFVLSVSAWIFGFLVWVPVILVVSDRATSTTRQNLCMEGHFGWLAIPLVIIFYGLPLTLAVVVYTKLVIVIKKRQNIYGWPAEDQKCKNYTQSGRTKHIETHSSRESLDLTRNHRTKPSRLESTVSRINSQNMQCTKTSLLIVILFSLCWAPFSVLFPIFHVCQNCVSENFYRCAYIIPYANSLINPLVYIFTSSGIRNGIKNIFCGNDN